MPEDGDEAFVPHAGWLSHEPGDEVIRLLRRGIFEAAEQAFVRLFLRPGDTFLDGGAHVGLHSMHAANAVGSRGHGVVAVEPNASTAARLRRTLRRNGATGVTVVEAALWDGEARLILREEGAGRAAFARVEAATTGDGAVVAMTIDRLVERYGPFTLVKLDLEGAEPEAIAGATRSIAGGAVSTILVECTKANLERRGTAPDRLVERLRALGFSVATLGADGASLEPLPEGDPLWHRNLLATRDPAAVARRLGEASIEAKAIAADIVGRAEACDVHRELEELDSLRKRLDREADLEAWARRAESALGECRARIESDARTARLEIERLGRESAAERTGRLEAIDRCARLAGAVESARSESADLAASLAALRVESASLSERAERAERESASLSERADRAERESASLSERAERAERERAAMGRHAESISRSLAATGETLERTRAEAARLARDLSAANTLSAERLAWAERAEETIARLQAELADVRAWAIRSDDWLATERETVGTLRAERDALREFLTNRRKMLARIVGLGGIPPSGP